MIDRKQNSPNYLEEGMEEGSHIPAKLLPKQISKISGQKVRKTYLCDPKTCQQQHIITQGGMEVGVRRGNGGHCG